MRLPNPRTAAVIAALAVLLALPAAAADASIGQLGSFAVDHTARPAHATPGLPDIAADSSGNVYTTWHGEIQKYGPSGVLIRRITAPDGPSGPVLFGTVAVDSSRGLLYAADLASDRLLRFTLDGEPLPPLSFPARDIAVDEADGSLYLAGPQGIERRGMDGTLLASQRSYAGEVALYPSGPVLALEGISVVERFTRPDLRPGGFFYPQHLDDWYGKYDRPYSHGLAAAASGVWVGDVKFSRIEQFGLDEAVGVRCAVPGLLAIAAGSDGTVLALSPGRVTRFGESQAPVGCAAVPTALPPAIESFSFYPSRIVEGGEIEMRLQTGPRVVTVVLRLSRIERGRRWRGSCRRATLRLAKRPPCRLTRGLGTQYFFEGRHTDPLTGPKPGRTFKPGRYLAQVKVLDESSYELGTAEARFVVVRERPRNRSR